MPSLVKNSRFAFYHQNEPLLFQFLLHECLSIHHVLNQIPRPDCLLPLMSKMNTGGERWFPLSGHLPRLCHYCSLFTTHFVDPASSLCQHLNQTIERVHNAATEALQVKEEATPIEYYLPLKQEMGRLMTLLIEKLDDYQNDPSVLYFLLRHQEAFDAAYCGPLIKKTFENFFPGGVPQARAFLAERFAKKGFDHLIPSVEEELKKINLQAHDEK